MDRHIHEEPSMCIAGVDEAGCGPLAGPVIAAAVILDPNRPVSGLADSKTLSEKRREFLAGEIQTRALAWAIGRAEVVEIDAINILQARLLAMQRAVAGLGIIPKKALVDGGYCPQLPCPGEAVIKGDSTIAVISAASILAKVVRDAEMLTMHECYPQYGFDRHKGYPTALHLAALKTHGICPEHRRSFAPVRAILKQVHKE